MSDSRARHLIEAGEFQLASELLRSRKELAQDDRVLRAHLELELGDVATAWAQADSLLRESLDTRTRAYCLSIAGKALGRLGDSAGGLRQLRKAVSLTAKEDPNLAAELFAQTIACLLTWIAIEPALAELPGLRKAALETGDTYALIEYHIVNAAYARCEVGWSGQRLRVEWRRTYSASNLTSFRCLR